MSNAWVAASSSTDAASGMSSSAVSSAFVCAYARAGPSASRRASSAARLPAAPSSVNSLISPMRVASGARTGSPSMSSRVA